MSRSDNLWPGTGDIADFDRLDTIISDARVSRRIRRVCQDQGRPLFRPRPPPPHTTPRSSPRARRDDRSGIGGRDPTLDTAIAEYRTGAAAECNAIECPENARNTAGGAFVPPPPPGGAAARNSEKWMIAYPKNAHVSHFIEPGHSRKPRNFRGATLWNRTAGNRAG